MPKFGGYDFAHVVTCGLTRFTRVFSCTKHITGEETIKILLEEWFRVYGAPKEINSDEDVPAHRFLIYDLSVNLEMQLFRFPIISPDVTVEKIGKLIVNSLFPKSLWFEFHRQTRIVPACNCRGTDRRKMKVKEMPVSQNLPLGE